MTTTHRLAIVALLAIIAFGILIWLAMVDEPETSAGIEKHAIVSFNEPIPLTLALSVVEHGGQVQDAVIRRSTDPVASSIPLTEELYFDPPITATTVVTGIVETYWERRVASATYDVTSAHSLSESVAADADMPAGFKESILEGVADLVTRTVAAELADLAHDGCWNTHTCPDIAGVVRVQMLAEQAVLDKVGQLPFVRDVILLEDVLKQYGNANWSPNSSWASDHMLGLATRPDRRLHPVRADRRDRPGSRGAVSPRSMPPSLRICVGEVISGHS